ncbi:MAG: alpha/beta fold hydrolase [Primorskyibacter sp.]
MLSTAPFRDDLVDAPHGTQAFWVRADDGVRLRLGLFPAPTNSPETTPKPRQAQPQGTVLLFPGRTEYIEKYTHIAAQLGQAGFTTLAIDWRGQGLADRLLPDPMPGHVGQFADYQRDVAAMLEAARTLDLPQPYYLIAHSMGGAIGLRALTDGLPVRAVAFTGPMWGIALPLPVRAFAYGVGHAMTALGIQTTPAPGTKRASYVQINPFTDNTLTTDPEMYAQMCAQIDNEPGFALGGPTMQWLLGALYECRALAALPSPDVPCITYLGTQERIVDTHAIHDRMARWPKGDLTLITGAEHEILLERPDTRARVCAEVSALFTHAGAR